jgi:hypothetical protein
MEDANIHIKKGVRKSKKDPEPVEPQEEQHEEEQLEVEEKPKKPKTKKTAPKVETEDYDVEQQPDVIIHKRHKGAKPRKIIVITGDSDADESDEELPYRAKPKVEVKPRPKPTPVEPKPVKPKPAKPVVVPVQKVSQKPNADVGAGLPERYALTNKPKTGFVVDEFIDKLLGL